MTREEAIEILEVNRPDPCFQMLREAVDFAVDALKAQIDKDTNVPINDCISRQAMFDTAAEYEKQLREIFGDENELVEVVKILKHRLIALPSAQPEQRWIPVTERLPEYGVAVLTYDGSCYCVEKRIPTIRDDNGEPISSEWWVSDDYDESNSEYYPNLRDGACIAWMPLPEPYKRGEPNEDRR